MVGRVLFAVSLVSSVGCTPIPGDAPPPDPVMVTDGGVEPWPAALFGEDVVFADHHTGRVLAVPRDGGDVRELSLAPGQKIFRFAVTDTEVFYTTEASGPLYRAERGEAGQVHAESESPRATYVCVHGNDVFFAAGGAVSAVPRSGGAPEVVVDGYMGVDELLCEPDALYVIGTVGAEGLGAARQLVKVDYGSRESTMLADVGGGDYTYSADGEFIYSMLLAPGGFIAAVPKAGGPAVTIVQDIEEPGWNPVVFDDAVYWSEPDANNAHVVRLDRETEERTFMAGGLRNASSLLADERGLVYTSRFEGRVWVRDFE